MEDNLKQEKENRNKLFYQKLQFLSQKVIITEKELRVQQCKDQLNKNVQSNDVNFEVKTKAFLDKIEQVKAQLTQEGIVIDNFVFTVQNEFDQTIYLPQTVKLCKIEQSSLKDYKSLADFISFNFYYEPFKSENKFSDWINSPDFVISSGRGDAFDISTLACSILLGMGYDAYVVNGTSCKELTMQSLQYFSLFQKFDQVSQLKTEKQEEKKQSDEVLQNEYYIEKEIPQHSKVDQQRAELEIKRKLKEQQGNIIYDDCPDINTNYLNQEYYHCWILIRKNIQYGLNEDLFIDFSNNFIINTKKSNGFFNKVFQVFNDQVLYLNLNQSIQGNQLDFNFNNDQNQWRKVLDQSEKSQTCQDEQQIDLLREISQQKLNDILLLKPNSFFNFFNIKQTDQINFNIDKQTNFFAKAQVDIFLKNFQEDGLIQRITKFEDFEQIYEKEVWSFYQNRLDYLVQTIYYPLEQKMIFFYSKNTQLQDQNQKYIYQQKIETIFHQQRRIWFYPLRFHDGLIERTDIFYKKIIENFQDRDDYLVYKEVKFNLKKHLIPEAYVLDQRDIGKVEIQKIKHEYEKKQFSQNQKQIKTIIFDFKRQLITITYHLIGNQIYPNVDIVHRKDFTEITHSGFSHEKIESDNIIDQSYQIEKQSIIQIKQQEQSLKDFYQYLEEMKNTLNKPQEQQLTVKQEKDLREIEKKLSQEIMDKFNNEEEDIFQGKDIIGQYLEQLKIKGNKLDKQTSLKIKQEIQNQQKSLLVEWTAEMNQRYLEEKEKISQKQKEIVSIVQNDKQSDIQINQLQKEYQNIQDKLHILEEWIYIYQKLAFEQYEKLNKQLEQDYRIN